LRYRIWSSSVVDDRRDAADDPWLTLAEIAAELRINPATVRLWISRGRLKAKRAGQRKLLVQRSELDRMLDTADPSRQPPTQPRVPSPRPVLSRPLAGQLARKGVDPEQVRLAVKQIQQSAAIWDTAVEASNNAPPDPGFVRRLHALAEASEQHADALTAAGSVPGFVWTPLPDTYEVLPSHELRRGGNRPGPARLWTQFDMAVERLSIAVQGNLVGLIASEYHEISTTLREVADALDEQAQAAADEGLDDAGTASGEAA
jgi:excisionase family DNA binding protein